MADEDLCGIDGPDEAPVTHRAFNRWAARAMRHHVTPMKVTLGGLESSVHALIDEQAKLQARIEGALWAFKRTIWLVGSLLAVIIIIANFPQEVAVFLKLLPK